MKYAIVGTGGRAAMYVDAIVDWFSSRADLVGMCDPSQTRMDWHNRRIREHFGKMAVPTYRDTAFDRMIRDTKPDVVIVTTIDCHHHEYIIRSMELKCDVICEKPMTVDARKAHAILEAIGRTERSLRVTFNYRYTPAATKVRELIMKGTVGRPMAVDFAWVLDTSHGADYFRRWHARKENSGGLLVHKASHHFDLVNWWIDSRPQTVFAMGDLKFYGHKNARARGETYTYHRYTGQAAATDDPFALPLDQDENLRGLYLDAEKDSGYIRDRNVFGDHVDIEDTLVVTCRYHNSVLLNYSLVAYSPWEGFRVAITGTKGRLELYVKDASQIIGGRSDHDLATDLNQHAQEKLTVFRMFDASYEVTIPQADGGHRGGDLLLLQDLFSSTPNRDPLHRLANHEDGAASVLLGIAANQSITTGQPIDCDQLLRLQEGYMP